MEKKLLENRLIIFLPDRIGEGNAQQIKDELVLMVEENKEKDIVLNCSELKYISSAGLRSLLTAQKRRKSKIRLEKVSKQVREILDVTGFSDIFDVEEPVKVVNLDDCVKISESINGTIYRYLKGTMVKIFRDGVTLEEVQTERERAKKALICGVPTAISFAIVRANNSAGNYGIIFEDINTRTLGTEISEHPELIERYAKSFGRFMKELHQIEIDPGMLPNMKSRYKSWLESARGELLQTTWNALNDLIDRIEDSNTFVHGDINLNSVYLVDGEMMLMDMSSCGCGHPIFDLQALYATLVAIEKNTPNYCQNNLGLSPELCKVFWNEFIDEYMGNIEKGRTADKIVEKNNKVYKTDNDKLGMLLEKYYVLKEQLISVL